MSPFSMGLSAAAARPADGADFVNCGLDRVSEVDRFGLRSSSDRDRLMGSVGPGCLCSDFGAAETVLLPPEDVDVSEDHAGTGGRVMFGERAIFLDGCGLGAYVWWGGGAVQSLPDCWSNTQV